MKILKASLLKWTERSRVLSRETLKRRLARSATFGHYTSLDTSFRHAFTRTCPTMRRWIQNAHFARTTADRRNEMCTGHGGKLQSWLGDFPRSTLSFTGPNAIRTRLVTRSISKNNDPRRVLRPRLGHRQFELHGHVLSTEIEINRELKISKGRLHLELFSARLRHNGRSNNASSTRPERERERGKIVGGSSLHELPLLSMLVDYFNADTLRNAFVIPQTMPHTHTTATNSINLLRWNDVKNVSFPKIAIFPQF